MSKKQIPKYFEWSGRSIKAKGTKVYKKFYKEDLINSELITTRDYLLGLLDVIENFKDNYVLGFYKNGKIIRFTNKSSEIEFIPKGKWILCEKIGNAIVPIIANKKQVGKPKFYLIKGQDIYSGNLREHMRGFVMDEIKKCFKPFVKNIPVINCYPIKISCQLYDTIKNPYHKVTSEIGEQWDIDNYMYPYNKAFPDLLVAQGIIKNDDRLHLPNSIGTEFVPIKNHDDRKLVYIIEKDTRVELEPIFEIHRNANTYESEDLELVQDKTLNGLAEDTENFFKKDNI